MDFNEGRKAVKPKILCVDEESEFSNALSQALANDFTVLTSSTASQAKHLLNVHQDLAIILSSPQLPDGSGLDLMTLAQSLRPDAVRAILASKVDPAKMIEGLHRRLIHRVIFTPWKQDTVRLQLFEALSLHQTLKDMRALEKLAITDPVTLLRNHRFFQDQLKIEVTRALRHERSLSLIMLDLDNFKLVNDRYGHPAGDKLLQEVGRRLGEAVRNLDTVARYGGEEFAILLPDTKAENAKLVAERVRQRFNDNPFLVNGDSTLVTISLGIASCPEHAVTPESLVEAADQALYRAKGQGRNQSVVASKLRP